jgi:hypothetical protein
MTRLLSVIDDLSAATKRAGVSGAADGEVSRVAKGAERKSAAVWGNDTGNKPVSGTASHTSAFKLSAGLLRRDGMAASACLPLGWGRSYFPTAKRRTLVSLDYSGGPARIRRHWLGCGG